MSDKPPKVVDAEITEDGAIIIELNQKLYPHTSKVIFFPETILALAEEYGQIPPAEETDYPGIPVVMEEAIFLGDVEKTGEEN